MSEEFEDIPEPAAPENMVTASQTMHGPYIPAQQQILLYSPDQWESFIEEWVHASLTKEYLKVQKFSGANDKGIDIAGFCDRDRLQGVWDNYQCKHYDHALQPAEIWVELGKILWHSFSKAFKAPRRYYFVAPFGAGTTLAGLLSDSAKLEAGLIENWDKHCKDKITKGTSAVLEGAFKEYVDKFDFGSFDYKTGLEVVEEHGKSPHHAARFGGGLPPRPMPGAPPIEIAATESRYVAQLLSAYADHTKKPIADFDGLKDWPKLREHFGRQRVAFYHAESLRVFARDSVPPGTFESLQDDIHSGVADVHDSDHASGFEKVQAVTKAARELQITSNPLITCSKPADRDGICHQLANEDRLKWTSE